MGLDGYARFGAVPEPATLIAGVRSLPAAGWLRVRGSEVEGPRAYWRPACPERPAPRASVEVIAPGIEAARRGAATIVLSAGDRQWRLVIPAGLHVAIEPAEYSPSYGVKLPCVAIDVSLQETLGGELRYEFSILP